MVQNVVVIEINVSLSSVSGIVSREFNGMSRPSEETLSEKV